MPSAATRRLRAPTIAVVAPGPCTRVSATTSAHRGEAGRDRGDDVAARRRVDARDEADAAREPRQRPLPLGREEALGREPPRSRSSAAAWSPAPTRSTAASAEAQLPARLVELEPAEHLDALALGQGRLDRVEAPALDRRREAGAGLRVLEREEDVRPGRVPLSSETSPSTQTSLTRPTYAASRRLNSATP